ncbi:hypothetical protein HDU97_010432 [Phlyctochytrium planicorne]|nr:hypothetical protein HDU97_010432 [Phlyctochytrium planicorne]
MAKRKRPQQNQATKKDDDDYRKGSSMKAWQREEDIELDSEDEFHQQREVIRLDQSNSRFSDDDEYLSEEGVFDIDGQDSDEDNLDEEDERMLEKAQQHLRRGQQVEESDEEQEQKKDDRDEEGENMMVDPYSMLSGGWGRSRDKYYDADDLEDDEENARLEEEEALRLQKERLERMAEEDFLGDDEPILSKNDQSAQDRNLDADGDDMVTMSVEERIAAFEKLGPAAVNEMAQNRIPEVIEISKTLSSKIETWLDAFESLQKSPLSSHQLIYFNLLSSLFVNYTYYLSIRSHPDYFKKSKNHPAIKAIKDLTDLLEFWEKNEGQLPEEETPHEDEEDAAISAQESPKGPKGKRKSDPTKDIKQAPKSVPRQKTSKATEFDREEGADSMDSIKLRKPSLSLPDFKSLKSEEAKRKKALKALKGSYQNDFAEDLDEIDDVDLEDKLERKRRLKFQVSMSSKNLKQKKLPDFNGDADLPYRDRFGALIESGPPKEEDQEEELAAGGDDADVFDDADDFDTDYNLDDVADAMGMEAEDGEFDEEGEELYNQLANSKKRKPADSGTTEDLDLGLYDENDFTPGQKRGSTWAMLTNKGLTPKRKKEDRNPRVKKRMKYDKAKKKLSSIRAVAADKSKIGPYRGELTGIKGNVSKSIRF